MGLNPQLQDQFNKQQAISGARTDLAGALTGRMQNEFGQGADYSGLGPMGDVPIGQYTTAEGSIGDPNAFRQQGADAAYNSAMSRITPQYDEQRRAMEVKLSNQGLQPGDRAYDSAMEGIGQAETDATQQAIWGSQAAGRQEASQMYDQLMGQNQNIYNQNLGANQQNWQQAMSNSQYANQIRQQQIAEQQGMRGSSLNEMNALLSGQQVGMPQMPGFTGAQAAAPGPIYQSGVDAANSQAAGQQSLWGGLASLGGAGMGMYGMMNQG